MGIWEHPEILQADAAAIQKAAGTPGMSQKPELGLGILHTNNVTMDWAWRLALFIHKLPPFIPLFNRHSPYDVGREQIARMSLERECKWLFFLDSDVKPMIDSVPWLIQWSKEFKLPLISGLYWDKKPLSLTGGKPMPAAWIKVGEHPEKKKYDLAFANIEPQLKENSSGIFRCDVVGTGCMLIDTDIFRQLEKSDPEKPFFEWGVGRRDKWQLSEDFYFCMRCVNELDIHPHVALAVKCDHECMVVKRGSDGKYEMPMGV